MTSVLKKSFLLRATSAFTFFHFLFVNVTFAAPHTAFYPPAESPAPSFHLQIPSDFGKVENLVAGKGPALIQIQTAHGNYEAQKNIQAILHHLYEQYGVGTVFLEGTAYKLRPELLRFFPDPTLNLKIADQMTKQALVKGAELFLIKEPKAQAYGIENLDHYRENEKAIKAVFQAEKETASFIRDMDRQIERLSGPYLSSNLRSFLKRSRDFQEGRIRLQDWLLSLKQEAQKHLRRDVSDAVEQIDWPMLARYFKLIEFEEKFQAAAFEKERSVFLETVSRAGVAKNSFLYRELETQLKTPLNRSSLPYPEMEHFFEKVIAKLRPDFPYEKFPQVRYFVGHLILQSELSGEALHEEMGKMERLIAEKLAKTSEARKIVELLNGRALLAKLLHLQLTPRDYESVLAKGEAIKPSVVAEQFIKLNSLNRVRNGNFSNLAQIDEFYAKALEFYRGAKLRDKSMIQNLYQKISELGLQKAAVVTGGFHAGPFQDFFAGKGFNYALISPKISAAEKSDAYVESILRQSTFESPSLIGASKAFKTFTPSGAAFYVNALAANVAPHDPTPGDRQEIRVNGKLKTVPGEVAAYANRVGFVQGQEEVRSETRAQAPAPSSDILWSRAIKSRHEVRSRQTFQKNAVSDPPKAAEAYVEEIKKRSGIRIPMGNNIINLMVGALPRSKKYPGFHTAVIWIQALDLPIFRYEIVESDLKKGRRLNSEGMRTKSQGFLNLYREAMPATNRFTVGDNAPNLLTFEVLSVTPETIELKIQSNPGQIFNVLPNQDFEFQVYGIKDPPVRKRSEAREDDADESMYSYFEDSKKRTEQPAGKPQRVQSATEYPQGPEEPLFYEQDSADRAEARVDTDIQEALIALDREQASDEEKQQAVATLKRIGQEAKNKSYRIKFNLDQAIRKKTDPADVVFTKLNGKISAIEAAFLQNAETVSRLILFYWKYQYLPDDDLVQPLLPDYFSAFLHYASIFRSAVLYGDERIISGVLTAVERLIEPLTKTFGLINKIHSDVSIQMSEAVHSIGNALEEILNSGRFSDPKITTKMEQVLQDFRAKIPRSEARNMDDYVRQKASQAAYRAQLRGDSREAWQLEYLKKLAEEGRLGELSDDQRAYYDELAERNMDNRSEARKGKQRTDQIQALLDSNRSIRLVREGMAMRTASSTAVRRDSTFSRRPSMISSFWGMGDNVSAIRSIFLSIASSSAPTWLGVKFSSVIFSFFLSESQASRTLTELQRIVNMPKSHIFNLYFENYRSIHRSETRMENAPKTPREKLFEMIVLTAFGLGGAALGISPLLRDWYLDRRKSQPPPAEVQKKADENPMTRPPVEMPLNDLIELKPENVRSESRIFGGADKILTKWFLGGILLLTQVMGLSSEALAQEVKQVTGREVFRVQEISPDFQGQFGEYPQLKSDLFTSVAKATLEARAQSAATEPGRILISDYSLFKKIAENPWALARLLLGSKQMRESLKLSEAAESLLVTVMTEEQWAYLKPILIETLKNEKALQGAELASLPSLTEGIESGKLLKVITASDEAELVKAVGQFAEEEQNGVANWQSQKNPLSKFGLSFSMDDNLFDSEMLSLLVAMMLKTLVYATAVRGADDMLRAAEEISQRVVDALGMQYTRNGFTANRAALFQMMQYFERSA